jgi:predicted pyridoxine 5'-phosphate oxidase superfamily flavin-nucleotide-binding protein
MNNPASTVATPFHPGEQAVQLLAGVREQAENRGQKMLTPQLVDAQREFFAQLSFAVASQLDAKGQPWACLITGAPGFIQATPDGRVRIGRGGSSPPAGLDASFLMVGSPVGLLGIEFARRRRNRINGRVTALSHSTGEGTPAEIDPDQRAIELQIDQGFGNCPKYIHKRPWDDTLFTGHYQLQRSADLSATESADLPANVAALIKQADTFFIASSSGPALDETDSVQPQAWGSDISHRGGEPGFIQLEGHTLSFPDYPGNNMFNTLGNLQQYPPCGLILVDFATGAVAQMAGTATLNHDGTAYRVDVEVTEVRYWTKQPATQMPGTKEF